MLGRCGNIRPPTRVRHAAEKKTHRSNRNSVGWEPCFGKNACLGRANRPCRNATLVSGGRNRLFTTCFYLFSTCVSKVLHLFVFRTCVFTFVIFSSKKEFPITALCSSAYNLFFKTMYVLPNLVSLIVLNLPFSEVLSLNL